MSSPPKPPSGLSPSGRRLWRSINEHLELDAHEIVLLLEACRVADRLDALEARIASDGPLFAGRPHPALVEARQQQLVLARLIASLRLPNDLQAPKERERPAATRWGPRRVPEGCLMRLRRPPPAEPLSPLERLRARADERRRKGQEYESRLVAWANGQGPHPDAFEDDEPPEGDTPSGREGSSR